MKKLDLWLILLIGLAVANCGSSEKKTEPRDEIRDFGKYFIEKLSAGQLDSIKNAYPELLAADSLATVNSDTIIINETGPGQYDVALTPEIKLKVARSDDGTITVTESYGLFAFSPAKMEFARKTGMYDAKLNDAELNKRMKDEGFVAYVKDSKTVKSADIISIGKLKEPAELYGIMDTTQPLTNLTDQEISGDDYTVKVAYSWTYPATEENDNGIEEGIKYEPGKDIPARGTINYPMEIGFRGYSKIIGINWKISPEELQQKFAPYTGTEYQQYLNSTQDPSPQGEGGRRR